MIVSMSLFLFMGRILTYLVVFLVSISLIIIYLNFFLLLTRMSTIIFKWGGNTRENEFRFIIYVLEFKSKFELKNSKIFFQLNL